MTPERFNRMAADHLPGTLGLVITHVEDGQARAELPVVKAVLAPNGYLHAGTVVALADSSAGCGCFASLPEGAIGFTTIELKSIPKSSSEARLTDFLKAFLVILGRLVYLFVFHPRRSDCFD